MSQNKFGFAQKAVDFALKKKAAAIEIMRDTKVYFDKGFDDEGLGGQDWQEVARRTPGNPFNAGRYAEGTNQPTGKRFIVDQGDDYATRKILAGTTGRLRYKTVKADSRITQDGSVSVMINRTPYAGYINDGTPYMPARPFMKQTDELTILQLTILKTQTGKIWKLQ